MESTDCNHQIITLINASTQKRFRCRNCHLTISAQELGNNYCPECFEAKGKKNYNFEEMEEPEIEKVRYRCESCGTIIEC
ncbi:hypothetical protein MHK_010638 [Candidatus Magnetomorum sp. HK-1]|nr:hypothetical protein MHK_010638 [Candidatus Magnetomorum sp. HK-1]